VLPSPASALSSCCCCCCCISSGAVVAEIRQYLGIVTNNVAEYQALRLTLERAVELDIKNVNVFMDSKLVVEQLMGRWQIKNQHLKAINEQILDLVANFDTITFTHIYRNFNTRADKLANEAIN
jgi:probable phosphoglycerate mutase